MDHERPEWLQREQYGTDANLRARMALHERFSVNPQGWFPWLVGQLELAAGERVLEVGCGTGQLWAAAHVPPGGRLVLSDFSTGMLASAAATLRTAGRAANLVAADVRRLPFATGSFDVAVANHMLFHVPEPASALAELARVLRSGGRLLASTNGRAALREIDELAARHLGAALPASRHAERFGLETGPALVAAEFLDVRVRRYPDAFEVTEVEALVAFIASKPRSQSLSAAGVASLRAEIAARIERDGAVRITKDSGIILARRG